jgi:glycine cleavage system T protein (aminomethyltransferase)
LSSQGIKAESSAKIRQSEAEWMLACKSQGTQAGSLRHMRLSLAWRVTDTAQKKTPLYDEHVQRRARIISFGGWLMPVQYTSIVEEHQAVRNNIGMFDISHMGQLTLHGPNAGGWLNTMLTNNIEKLAAGQGQYTFLLNEQGGIIDDLIVYRVGSDEFLLVVNASRAEEDFAWMENHKKGNVDLASRSADFGGVAIQGPRVVDLFHTLLGDNVELPPRNHIADFQVHGIPVSIARTGYTGEDGVEIFFRAADAARFWTLVLEKGEKFGIKPCGLGARDTLRLEMCYPLNGSDLSPERNPLEAGLGFFVDLTKPEFIGRETLLRVKENGPKEKLAAFRMEGKGPPPRPHYPASQGDERIGEVTSGTLSPSLNYGIGMAYIDAPRAKVGSRIEIEIRERKFPAIIEKKPLYKKS